MHDAAVTAHAITFHATGRLTRFRALTSAEQSAVFEHLSPHVQQRILERLTDRELVALLDEMDLQRAENTLARIPNASRRVRISARLRTELREKAEHALRFHPKATLSLLNFNYLLLAHTATVADAADAIDEHYRETGKLPEILVHEHGRLAGEIPLAYLVRKSNRAQIGKFAEPITAISFTDSAQQIVSALESVPRGKVVVCDSDGSVIGIVYADDALALFGNHNTASLFNFAGVARTERPFDSALSKVKHRYQWLIVNLATTFVVAGMVGLFEHTLAELVILAVYMPVITGMGSNAATQTLAVIVRGITMGEITLENSWPAIRKEVLAGLVNGLLNGGIVALVATFFNSSPLLGVVLAIALISNLMIAGLFGSLIPLLMRQLGKDPATSATILISTTTDLVGFLVFLGLATIVLL